MQLSYISRRVPLFWGMFLLFLLKMTLLRYFMFVEVGWSGLAIDAAAILVLLSLVELITPMRRRGIVYWPLNIIYSLILFAATLYFEHFNSIPTYSALNALNQVTQIQSSIQATFQWSNCWYFADILAAAVIWIVWKVRRYPTPANRPVNKVALLITLACSLILSIRLIQIGLPIQNELAQAKKIGFVNYQVAAAFKSTAPPEDLNVIINEINSLQSSYPYRDKPDVAPAYYGAAKGKNVVVLQLEAFQNFPLHLSVGGEEVTPVLNQLADEGFTFPNVFQQIGQGNTSDAEFIMNTSIYPTGKIAMSTGYGDRKLPSLPRLLSERNYESSSFHVNQVAFWDRNMLYPALGFDHYVDKPYYNNDHFNSYGASDEELYRVGVDKLLETTNQGKLFYAHFISVSSHHPFIIKKEHRKINLPQAMEDTELGDYLYAINYADYAIGTLIDRLKDNGLWEDTMLVIYGDHAGLSVEPSETQHLSEQLGIPYDPQVSKFNIPFIIHIPDHTEVKEQGKVVNTVGGQLDMMPTVANLLGISLSDEQFIAFGHDLLNIDRNTIGMRYYLPTGSFFNDEILFIPGTGYDDGTAISIKTLEPITDLTRYRADYEYVLQLMKLSDRYVESLPRR